MKGARRHAFAFVILTMAGLSCGTTGAAGKETRSPGEAAFRASCQSCHSLPRPDMKTDAEWPSLVQRYGERARLTDDQIAAITAFLIASN